MSAFSQAYQADLRLAILELLAAAEVETTLPILRASLEAVTAHEPSLDQLAAEARWLKERGLVTLQAQGAAVSAAAITARGEDVATGREKVGGVMPGGRWHGRQG